MQIEVSKFDNSAEIEEFTTAIIKGSITQIIPIPCPWRQEELNAEAITAEEHVMIFFFFFFFLGGGEGVVKGPGLA